jgi:hypothetical protein
VELPDYRCRVCGTESEMVLGPTQAFCTKVDPDCPVFTFNPSLPDGGLDDAQVVNLER